MQSDGKSFIGDVFLDRFNMSIRDEDSILDQQYEKHIFFEFWEGLKKMHVKGNTAHNNKELITFGF